MRRSRASVCGTKIRHDSKNAALLHSYSLRRYGATEQQAYAYHCPFCKGWHVGHRTGRRG